MNFDFHPDIAIYIKALGKVEKLTTCNKHLELPRATRSINTRDDGGGVVYYGQLQATQLTFKVSMAVSPRLLTRLGTRPSNVEKTGSETMDSHFGAWLSDITYVCAYGCACANDKLASLDTSVKWLIQWCEKSSQNSKLVILSSRESIKPQCLLMCNEVEV